jgi:tRNA (guanine6-N2)-methyltransferase
MPQYYSTFPTGFEPAIEEFITRDMPGTQLLRIMEGAAEYKRRGVLTSSPKWFNNTFLCLTTFPRAPKEPLQDMVRLAVQRGIDSDAISSHMPEGASTFRAMFMLEGQLAHAGLKTMAKAEEFLARASGLKPGPAKPDVEFWFLYRREGIGFLLMRLTYHKDYAKELNPGELRPDISHLLCRLSNPRHDDVFLDPFAGYGGIVKARLDSPAVSITAGDIALHPSLRAALRGAANVVVLKMDALSMTAIPSGSVDAIVCDPPWGEHTPLADPTAFYGKFASEAHRVLKKDGRLIVLTALKKEAEAALRLNFSIDGRLDVLVSGSKAAVYICRN